MATTTTGHNNLNAKLVSPSVISQLIYGEFFSVIYIFLFFFVIFYLFIFLGFLGFTRGYGSGEIEPRYPLCERPIP